MKIAKNKVRFQTPFLNPIIVLEKLLKKSLKKRACITIKCHHTPGDNDSESYEINFYHCGGGSPEEWLVWKGQITQGLR